MEKSCEICTSCSINFSCEPCISCDDDFSKWEIKDSLKLEERIENLEEKIKLLERIVIN